MKIRQGDLLFIRIDAAPDAATVVSDGVIARGESSGHAHRLRAGRGRALLQLAGVLYVSAKYRALVDHEEHATVTLPIGDWEVRRQREYEAAGWREVVD